MVIAIIVIAVIAVYAIWSYNRLLAMRNRIKEAYAAVDVYLQNRFDALVKIAEAVVAYAKHERDTLKEITRIREGLDHHSPNVKLQTYENLNERLSGIRLLAENYPDLKASDNFIHLQHTVYDLEEKLSASRRTYNSNVVAFNTAIDSFPNLLFAGILGFKAQFLYEVPESKKEDVDMKQLLNG